MMTRLIRVLLTRSSPATNVGALLPLDAISGRKLLYSNPRLLRSSHLGETCPPKTDAKQRRAFADVLRTPDGASEAASRPGGRLAGWIGTAAHCGFGASAWPDSWTSVSVAGLLCAP
jgi:hypothetical protein